MIRFQSEMFISNVEVFCRTRTVHEDVDSSEFVDTRTEQQPDRFNVGNVHGLAKGSSSVRLDFISRSRHQIGTP